MVTHKLGRIINNRLNELMQAKGLNLTSLSKKSEVSIGTIQKLLTDPNCNPTLSSLESISNVLEVSIFDLIDHNNLVKKDERSIKLLTWESIPKNMSEISQINTNNSIKTTCQVSDEAFSLVMNGNSMLPLFPPGSTLIFDPQKSIYDGCFALIKLQKSTFVMKQVLIDGPDIYIKSTNPELKEKGLTLLNGNGNLVAVLVQSQTNH